MIKSFPLGLFADGLTAADFETLAGAFAIIISRAIPGQPSVSFPTSASEIASEIAREMSSQITRQNSANKDCSELYRRLVDNEESGIALKNMLLLALPLQNDGRQVVLAVHVDETVTTLATADWLRELAARLPAELLAAKRLWLDHETGLPNTACLRADLTALAKNSQVGENRRLLLVETPPLATGRDGFAQAMAMTEALRAFCRNARLFHLGQCLFAILSEDATKDQLAEQPTERPTEQSAAELVWHLKNEGFRRVRLGSSGTAKPAAGSPLPEATLLDRAWTALLEARRRGSFGFCDFTALAQTQAQTSASWRPNGNLLAHFSSQVLFAVLALTVPSQIRSNTLNFLAEQYENIFIDGRTGPILVFLADNDGGQARRWAQTMLAALTARLGQACLYAGIAVHAPDSHEPLRAVVVRAIKAIRHAEFYGPGGIAIFDAVTCNVAGDADFADGNLPKAIKEYRAGLTLEPDNGNLLNSLGVALAMLDNNGEAGLCFQKALQADAANYMALANLGFIAQGQERLDEAIEFFARALPLAAANESEGQEDHQLAQNLRFYLGRLYCRTGRYHEAVEMLRGWQHLCTSEQERGKAWRYLGKALAGTGEKRQAMAALQRAVASNPGGHEAMSLLGELIMLFHEGDDIALSLCRKSVELAPYSPLYRLRLAEAEYRTGDLPSALIDCPRPSRLKAELRAELEGRITHLLADIYQQMGETKKAARWVARR